jgi:HlyD family secretion protein
MVRVAQEREESAKVESEFTAERFDRFKRLLSGGAVAREQVNQVEAQAKQAQALYLAAQAAANAARADLKRAESTLAHSAAQKPLGAAERIAVPAPRAGHVLKLYRESEGAVNAGEPVLDIGDPQDIEVRVDILSADAVKIRQGTPVLFDRWGGVGQLTGTVKTVEPSGFTKVSSLGVEEQRVLVIVEMTSDAQTRSPLGDGYRIEAAFIVWEGKDVLQIPASALFRAGEQWAVFTAEGNRARRQIVEIGHRNGLQAEILSGLAEGAAVITQPNDAIKDGGRIRISSVEK